MRSDPPHPSRFAWIVVASLATLLAACETPPATLAPAPPPAPIPVVVAAPAPAPPSDAAVLSALLLRVKNLSNAQLAQELVTARAEQAATRDYPANLRLAALLWQQGNDDGEALRLLEPVVTNGKDPVIRALALLLQSTIGERRRGREAPAAQAKWREAQRQLELEQSRAEQLRQQVDALQRRLEAVKSMEKGLLERAPKTE